ncbi:MAG: ATP-binding protein [Candidatus Thermochlorobacter sp.]
MKANAPSVRQAGYLEVIIKIQQELLACKDLSLLYTSILSDIRQATGASRAYFFSSHLHDTTQVYTLVAESYEPPLSLRTDITLLQALPHSHVPHWTVILMHNGLVYGKQDDFASEERFFMSSQNIQSILLAPIIAEQRFFGFLGLDDCKQMRDWSAAEKEMLQHLATALAFALLREQTVQDLMYSRQEQLELMEMLAHDLKNPLSAILLTAEVLIKNQDKLSREEMEKRLSNIKQSVLRMKDICDTMLQSRRSTQIMSMTLCLEPIGLTNVIETVVDALRIQAAAKGQQLVVEASKEVPKALGDRIVVMQVLENLISNAIKFSPSGKTIWIRLSDHDKWIHIEVADEGPGVKKEERSKLFQKRAKLSVKPTGGEGSTGYGLWICKTLVEAMRGKIWYEERQGYGATFILALRSTTEVNES